MYRLALTVSLAALATGCTTMADRPVTTATFPAAAAAPLEARITSDLPRSARPTHYTIEVAPDATTLTFTGKSAVDLELYEATNTLTLHALDLKISRAVLVPQGGGAPIALDVRLDPDKQLARFVASHRLAPGLYRLETDYTGTINTQANGLFALDYTDKVSGAPRRGLFTQFEAPDARRFAPMFDEPIYKATFDLAAIVPADQMAVSNMPVAGEEALAGGRKRVTFRTSPKMSSYLLFFGLGDFERLAKSAGDGVEVGIVSPKGSGEQARYSLDSLAPLVGYYSDYFQQPYPLPKLDNIAGPGQSQFFGAMENWGAIFTFERILLVDPKITSEATRQQTYGTQAHETAHQWFGDLVTMEWWDDLWLNEGFASWMATKATDHFNPGWSALLGRVGGREEAMTQDAYVTTHPIVQKISTVEETNQAFDDITYDKGEAVISMLEAYAGEDVWREGLRAYMRDRKFANARTEDLWRAVEAAGATGLTSIAQDFTSQPGIPLVRVSGASCSGGKTDVTLERGEFSRDARTRADTRPLAWKVPLLVSAGGAPVRHIMAEPRVTMSVPGCGPLVVNAGQLGYYRSLYTPAMVGTLAGAMGKLAPIDQLGLLRDNFALAAGDYQDLGLAIDLLRGVPGDVNGVVFAQVANSYNGLYDTLENSDTVSRGKFATLAGQRLRPRLEALGLDPRPGESAMDANLRSTLLRTLGAMGDARVIIEARRRFGLLDSNPRALDGPLKTTWLGIVAGNVTRAEWQRLAALAAASANVERATYFTMLGRTNDPALAREALALALTDQPGKTTSAAVIAEVGQRHADMTYDFIRANQAKIDPLIDASARGRFLARVAASSNDPAMAGKLDALAKSLRPDERKPVNQAIVRLRDRLATVPRQREQLKRWLTAQTQS